MNEQARDPFDGLLAHVLRSTSSVARQAPVPDEDIAAYVEGMMDAMACDRFEARMANDAALREEVLDLLAIAHETEAQPQALPAGMANRLRDRLAPDEPAKPIVRLVWEAGKSVLRQMSEIGDLRPMAPLAVRSATLEANVASYQLHVGPLAIGMSVAQTGDDTFRVDLRSLADAANERDCDWLLVKDGAVVEQTGSYRASFNSLSRGIYDCVPRVDGEEVGRIRLCF